MSSIKEIIRETIKEEYEGIRKHYEVISKIVGKDHMSMKIAIQRCKFYVGIHRQDKPMTMKAYHKVKELLLEIMDNTMSKGNCVVFECNLEGDGDVEIDKNEGGYLKMCNNAKSVVDTMDTTLGNLKKYNYWNSV